MKIVRIDLYRHGPKNNNPVSHGTGVEASLDPEYFDQINDHASFIATDDSRDSFSVGSSVVGRAKNTAKIVAEKLRKEGKKVEGPCSYDLLSSNSLDLLTGNVVNLSPLSMSNLWAEAKKEDNYSSIRQAEGRPLYAWFSQGLDNPQAGLLGEDVGIPLREIAWRVGTYVESMLNGTQAKRVIGYGHSGDIEPWIALTIQMQEGNDDGRRGTTVSQMQDLYHRLGGALNPLQGVSIVEDDAEIYLIGSERGPDFGSGLRLDRKIIEIQSQLYLTEGISSDVLAKKRRR